MQINAGYTSLRYFPSIIVADHRKRFAQSYGYDSSLKLALVTGPITYLLRDFIFRDKYHKCHTLNGCKIAFLTWLSPSPSTKRALVSPYVNIDCTSGSLSAKISTFLFWEPRLNSFDSWPVYVCICDVCYRLGMISPPNRELLVSSPFDSDS